MELVDQLLAILVGPNRSGASSQLRAAGYSEDEIRGAWNFARAAGYTRRFDADVISQRFGGASGAG